MLSSSCLLVLVVLSFSSCCLADDLPPLKDSDQQVLSTICTSWQYLPTSWKSTNTTLGCYWPGISCTPDPVDASYSTVVSLSVVGAYGPLIPDIANLTNLATFNAQSCNFQQTAIPSEFANLVNMEQFTLTSGQVVGPLPDLSTWQKLTVLSLGGGSFQQFPSWIVNIPTLQYVYLGSISLTGSIPQNIGDALPNLITFSASHNQLTGDFPVSLANAKNLSNIQLQNNNFTCLPNQASSFTFLDFCREITTCLISAPGCPQYLHPSETQYLTDLINQWSPSCLPGNWTIANVDEACNIPFEGVTCSEYWTLSEIELSLPPGVTCLSVSTPSSLFDAPYLNGILIDGYNFDGTLPATFSTTNASSITLTNMFITDPIPPINKDSLYLLDLSGNFIEKMPDAADLDGGNLIFLDISFNPITGDLSFLSGLELMSLNISGCSFSGDLSFITMEDSIGNIIDLSHNQLTGSIPSALLSMSASTIVMKNNQLSGSINIESSSYTAMTLDLSNNKLSGTLPSTMFNHNTIILDNNQFTGTIPDVTGFTVNSYLSIRNNSLTGDIPVSLSQNIYTTVLQFDGNHGMSGVIPEELTSMYQLNTFTFTGTNLQCPTSESWNTWASTVADITCGLSGSVTTGSSGSSNDTTNGSTNGGTTNGSTKDDGSSNGGLPDDFWIIFGSVALGVIGLLVVAGIVAFVIIKLKNRKREDYQLV